MQKTKIIQEKAIKIVHCLGALKSHGKIKQILSKDQALEQASKYLYKNYPYAETLALPSTSEAVFMLVKNKMIYAAAISSEEALKESGLEILAKDICPENKTRFVVLGRKSTKQTGDDKTFLVVHPPYRDRPGVLNNILGFFAGFGINLEIIQSRPDGKKGYYFYIELDGHEKDKEVKMAIDSIKLSLNPVNQYPNAVKVLGSYKNTRWKD